MDNCVSLEFKTTLLCTNTGDRGDIRSRRVVTPSLPTIAYSNPWHRHACKSLHLSSLYGKYSTPGRQVTRPNHFTLLRQLILFGR